MPMVINTNASSLHAQRRLNENTEQQKTHMERLSSGKRINRAKDDAAGLAISERLTNQVHGNDMAIRNLSDGISLIQTAEGILQGFHETLQVIREKMVQVYNGTNSEQDKLSLINDIQEALGANMLSEEFNGIRLFTNDPPKTVQPVVIQAGDKASDTIVIPLEDINANHISTGQGLDSFGVIYNLVGSAAILNAPGAYDMSFQWIDNAIEYTSHLRSTFGAAQNRLESAVRNNEAFVENTSASRSRIQDADYARETAGITRTQIIQQAGTAMLTQANQLPQNVMSLLQG